MYKIGLVLEGGGLRGIYTNGILDKFIDEDLVFPYCIGVSAGVCNAVSYISKQKFRSRDINLTYINDKRYLGAGNFIKTGSIFGYKMMLDTIPNELMPFDYDTYEKSECTLYAAVTNCVTGKPEYYPLKNLKDNYCLVQATTSLPFVSKMVEYKGNKYLDGGLTDSIPIKKAMEDGYSYNIVVLTRHKGYRKEPSAFNAEKIIYRKYPKLAEAIRCRYIKYNETLDYIEQLEKEGKVFVFRPSRELDCSRVEKNVLKLRSVYDIGVNDTQNNWERFKSWLKSVDLAE